VNQGLHVVKDEKTGDLVTATILGDEQYEILKMLSESPAWRLYRQLLIQAKEGYFHQALAMNDPHQVMKTMGTVAGINLAVNQLAVLMAQYKQKQARAVDRATKNDPQTQA
jgi:hypothetical protein